MDEIRQLFQLIKTMLRSDKERYRHEIIRTIFTAVFYIITELNQRDQPEPRRQGRCEVIFEEFKGTGNMEIHLDRKMSEKRIFPAIDIYKSGTRKEELLLSKQELEAVFSMRKTLSSGNPADATEQLIAMMERTETNEEFVNKLNNMSKAYERDGFSAGKRIN